MNTIFASHLIESKARLLADEPPRQTTEIQTVSHCNVNILLYPSPFSNSITTAQWLRRMEYVLGSTLSTLLVTEIKSTTKTGKITTREIKIKKNWLIFQAIHLVGNLSSSISKISILLIYVKNWLLLAIVIFRTPEFTVVCFLSVQLGMRKCIIYMQTSSYSDM